ncbi:hypothetical protein B0H16DRAFT_1486580 [Mycena metata]|uniref:Uncharacterized protein n=1 Tax=Mycena metata TaxID=1033252 RepID=A0AAD7DI85_9AGAR|nr:hypothetical protein B0H16DRAFT_1486580 [Mycena metata]
MPSALPQSSPTFGFSRSKTALPGRPFSHKSGSRAAAAPTLLQCILRYYFILPPRSQRLNPSVALGVVVTVRGPSFSHKSGPGSAAAPQLFHNILSYYPISPPHLWPLKRALALGVVLSPATAALFCTKAGLGLLLPYNSSSTYSGAPPYRTPPLWPLKRAVALGVVVAACPSARARTPVPAARLAQKQGPLLPSICPTVCAARPRPGTPTCGPSTSGGLAAFSAIFMARRAIPRTMPFVYPPHAVQ